MESNKSTKPSMRIIHRYLGYFLAGIMAVYALSGMVLVYRSTDVFKVEKQIEKKLDLSLDEEALGKALRIRNMKVSKTEDGVIYFDTGTYNKNTGVANYTSMELPYVLNKLTKLHKSSTNDSLYWLNLFFGAALLFLVVSSFWMYRPKTSVFRKGLYFTIAGIILTLVLLFI